MGSGQLGAAGLSRQARWACSTPSDFFDSLLAFNHHMAEIGFVREAHRGILIAETELDLLLTRMIGA